MTLRAYFWTRAYGIQPAAPRVRVAVQRYAWNAIGGPSTAEIVAHGSSEALWEFVEMLRCPVEIQDHLGEARWWGFVAEVELQINALKLAVSLDSMANKVAVAYAYVPAGSATVGTRATTAWASDAESVAEYGTFERLESSSSEETLSAVQLRDTILAASKYPVPTPSVAPGQQGFQATIRCRGWWETLARRYYANAGTDLVATTSQIADIITAVGEFIAGVDIPAASGISSSEYRDGDTNAQAEIASLLQTGTTNSRRMLATVTRERWLRVYEEPAEATNDYLLLADGSLRDPWDGRLAAGECPVGVWARPKDIIPGSVDLSRLANPATMFIESAEWDDEAQTLTMAFRGAPAPLNIGGVAAG